MYKRTIIVGDVHGCIDELLALLRLVDPTKEDSIVFVGDLIHRGPDSVGVVKQVRQMQEWTNVVYVMCNHEEKHNRWRRNIAKGIDRMKNVEEYPFIERGLSDEDVAFMESAVLFHMLPDYGSIVLHGGVLPGTVLPKPEEIILLSGKKRKELMRILRIRDVNPDEESMIKLGEVTDEDVFWTSLYDGRYGHIYFGHHPFIGAQTPTEHRAYVGRPIGPVGERVESTPHSVATGMDLGCVFGGRLAAVILEPGREPPSMVVTVKARKTYSQQWKEE